MLPSSATKSGKPETIRSIGENPADWGERVSLEALKPEVKIPAIVYLHSCSGIGGMTYQWAQALVKFGVSFFAPDSMRRPGRRPLCYDAGAHHYRDRMRLEEARFAARELAKQRWIDAKRLILVGFSEGAWGTYGGPEYTAQILLASDCRYAYGWVKKSEARPQRPAAPDDVAVLNIVGAQDDDGYGRGCVITDDGRGSRVVVLEGRGHRVYPDDEALSAVAAFLRTCCNIDPIR